MPPKNHCDHPEPFGRVYATPQKRRYDGRDSSFLHPSKQIKDLNKAHVEMLEKAAYNATKAYNTEFPHETNEEIDKRFDVAMR